MFARFLSLIFLTAGFLSFMLAETFRRLAQLSTSFNSRPHQALIIGFLTLFTGLFLFKRSRQKMKLLRALLIALTAAWLLLAGLIYSNQDRLLFSPRGFSEAKRVRITQNYPQSEELIIKTPEDTELQGWFLPSRTQKPAPLILVFPGQGGEASSYLRLWQEIPEFAWAFFNYRGYGLSTGKPNEQGFFADALLVFDQLSKHPLVDQNNIFAIGGSLGTGVATFLASQRPLRAVALFSPYDKIGGGVARDLLPLLPTGLLINNKFAAINYAKNAQCPALAIVGGKDQVIKPRRSRNLMNSWASDTQLLYLPEEDHYSIYQLAESWHAVRNFFLPLVQ